MPVEQNALQELTEQQCWQHLEGKSVGRLAVSVANRPDIFPVNYRVDGRTIVVRTAPGFKLAAATLGAGVAFEIDQLDNASHSGWSVVVQGDASEIDRLEELLQADDLGVRPWAGGTKNHYIRINPLVVTGRRIDAQPS